MRTALSILALTLSFLSFYLLGAGGEKAGGSAAAPARDGPETARSAPPAGARPAPAAPPAASIVTAKPEAIRSLSGAPLFERLFDGRRLGGWSELESAIRERFSTLAPAEKHSAIAEATARVGILKALAGDATVRTDRSSLDSALSLEMEIGMNAAENPAVRRQAFRNVISRAAVLDEQERMKLLSRIPGRFLASAAQSEQEILQELFREP